MGGRGASSGGMAGGGNINIISTTSLISKEGKPAEINSVLGVLKDVDSQYGTDSQLSDGQLAKLGKKDQGVMAYYDSQGNLAVNEKYFDTKIMNDAYDKCVSSGFHPPRGNKSGLEAVAAHEMGHKLTDAAGVKAGAGSWKIDSTADKIVNEAASSLGYKNTKSFVSKISGYAKHNNAEAVAEAFADVYCNGTKARKESRAIVKSLNKYFGK